MYTFLGAMNNPGLSLVLTRQEWLPHTVLIGRSPLDGKCYFIQTVSRATRLECSHKCKKVIKILCSRMASFYGNCLSEGFA